MHEWTDFPGTEDPIQKPEAGWQRVEVESRWESASSLTVRIVAPRLLCLALSSTLRAWPDVRLVDGPAEILVMAGSDWEERIERRSRDDGQADLPGLLLICDARTDFAAATRAGIRAFVGEDEDLPELLAALRAALCRQPYCSPRTLSFLLGAFQSAPPVPHPEPPCPGLDRLSHRELEVARKVAEGLTNQQVARLLHVSEPTVKFHLKQVFRKLGITCRSRLAYVFSAPQPLPPSQQPYGGADPSLPH